MVTEQVGPRVYAGADVKMIDPGWSPLLTMDAWDRQRQYNHETPSMRPLRRKKRLSQAGPRLELCNGASQAFRIDPSTNQDEESSLADRVHKRTDIAKYDSNESLRKRRIPTELSLESKIQMKQPINTRQQHSADQQPISMPAQRAFEFKSSQLNAAAFYNTQPTNQRTAFGGGICYALSVPYTPPIYFLVWIGGCLGFT